jgi:hypothetical protein
LRLRVVLTLLVRLVFAQTATGLKPKEDFSGPV